MTTYRLFPSTSGPSSPVSYTGNILIGVIFKVTQGGMWFSGYWKWVATGEDTTARKFALWQITGASTGSLIPAATVTSGTLTANSWNFVPLATPIPLAIGTAYNACTGWAAVSGHGFSDSDTSGAGTGATDSFGSGGHSTGITNGPLFAYSDQPSNGTKPEPYGTPQGVFSVAGTDASVNMPGTGSNSGNFWMDVQVSDTGPADYSGSYRLWPTKVDANGGTTTDASVNYEVATEFALSQACTLNKIWYYSPTGATQLATSASIWSVTAPGTSGTQVYTQASPSWSGAAASGWISITVTGVVLSPGKYKVGVYNGAGTPAAAFAKDALSDYWRNGDGANGITWGPISAPNLAGASTAFNYNGNAGGSPPFSDGTTLAGQSTFTQGPPDAYPYLVALVTTPAAGSTQNYWVDAEVTPVPVPPMSPVPARPGRTWLRRYRHQKIPALMLVAASPVSGAGGLLVPPVALACSGTEEFAGSPSVILPAPAVAGASTEAFTGPGSATPPMPAVSGTGSEEFTGSGGPVLPSPVMAGAGTGILTGTGALALPAPTLAGSGTGAGLVTGTGSLTLPVAVASAAGGETFAGPGALLLPSPATSGSGTAGTVFPASGGLLMPQLGLAGTGLRGYIGAAAATMPSLILAGSGSETITGSGSLVLPAVAVAAAVPAVFGYGFLVPAAGPTAVIDTAAAAGAVIGGGTP